MITLHLVNLTLYADEYFEPTQTAIMELFYENK